MFFLSLLVRLKGEIAKKTATIEKEKALFHQDNAPYHKSIAKWIALRIASAPTLFSKSGPREALKSSITLEGDYVDK